MRTRPSQSVLICPPCPFLTRKPVYSHCTTLLYCTNVLLCNTVYSAVYSAVYNVSNPECRDFVVIHYWGSGSVLCTTVEYNVHCEVVAFNKVLLHTVHCIVSCILHTVHCKLPCTGQCTVYSLHCTLTCTGYIVHNPVQCSVHCVHYPLCAASHRIETHPIHLHLKGWGVRRGGGEGNVWSLNKGSSQTLYS